MTRLAAIALILVLAGCASPTMKMSDNEIHGLNDDILCHYKNNYRDEMRLDAEIARRGLICDPYVRECMARGNQPGTAAMNFCVDLLHENQRLRHDNFYYHDVYRWHRPHAAFEAGLH